MKQTIKFNENNNPEFFTELRRRVNLHFKENKISKQGNLNMVLKSIFMIAAYATPLAFLIFGNITSLWVMYGLWIIMGFAMSGIGLSIMHDANHGSYSKSQRVNNVMGFILNFIGGYHHNWKIQHNVLHHSFTNIHGYDEDIDKQGIVRFSPTQEHKPLFKYQIFYVPFLYSILTLYWCVFKDIEQVVRYKKSDLLKTQGLTFKRALAQIIFHKTWYFLLTIALPIYMSNFAWWHVVLGFLLMQGICGMILALIFQSAHVIGETSFYEANEQGEVENNWAIHQMQTTANFSRKSRVFSWFIGGLNYQIEHHLFPNICHVHYRDLSPIIKSTAAEYNVPYYEHKTFLAAIKSHFSLIHKLGIGKDL